MDVKRIRYQLESAISSVNRRLSTDDLNTRLNVLRTAMQGVDWMDKALEAISLSDRDRMAKRAARKNLAVEASGKFGFAKQALQETQSRIKGLRETLGRIEAPIKNEITREIRNSELRGAFRQLTPNQRATAFIEAAEHGHMELLDAVLSAPDREIVTAEIRQRGLDLYNVKTRPNQVEALASAELLEQDLRGITESIETFVTALPSAEEEMALTR